MWGKSKTEGTECSIQRRDHREAIGMHKQLAKTYFDRVIWNILYLAMKEARWARLCLPEPPSPTRRGSEHYHEESGWCGKSSTDGPWHPAQTRRVLWCFFLMFWPTKFDTEIQYNGTLWIRVLKSTFCLHQGKVSGSNPLYSIDFIPDNTRFLF